MGRRKHPRAVNDCSSDQQPQYAVAASVSTKVVKRKHKKKQKKWHPRATWMEQVIDKNNTNDQQPLVILLNNNDDVAADAADDEFHKTLRGAAPVSVSEQQQLTIIMTRVLLEDDFWKQTQTTTANSNAELADNAKKTDDATRTDGKNDKQEAVDDDGTADANEEGLTAAAAAIVMNPTVDSLQVASTDAAASQNNDNHSIPSLSFCKLVIRNHFSCSIAPPYMPKHVKLLPHGDNGDGLLNPHSNISNKFWAQRHRLFSKFSSGIRLDEAEAWYSVTPEAIAHHVARKMLLGDSCMHDDEREAAAAAAAAAMTGNGRGCNASLSTSHDDVTKPTIKTTLSHRPFIILDAFCGWGGNAIAFGQHANVLVIAVDLHQSRLEQAAHNAKIYNVPAERLLLVHANALQVMERYQNGRRITTKVNDATCTAKDASSANAATIDGYRIGGLELLPDYIDAIFLSPPWGGPSYQKTSSNSDDSFPLSRIQIQKQLPPTLTNELTIDSGSDDGAPKQMVRESTETEAFVNGAELLAMALRALPMKDATDSDHDESALASSDALTMTPKYRLAYFLPRNINGVSVGRAAWQAGFNGESVELEQQYLQHKFKTVTAYLS
ncbi:hypothetical protein MPSEU_000871200 [Mayamaea pseudoterrestris]|nr:hypothetical protein MPSEU_000871200 [Mayamaea pseudoterrestris]